nr:DDE-type integrase/transposase/recombinase [Alteribacillus bidgolensis]
MKIHKPFSRWIYLCAVNDLYNQKIVAYALQYHQGMSFVYNVLAQLKEKGFGKGTLLHSDQRFQFTNPSYIKHVANMGMTQSMSCRSNCWDNACIEYFFGHFKCKLPCFGSPQTFEEMHEPLTLIITKNVFKINTA